MGHGSIFFGATMSFVDTAETAAATVALVVILFVALFFIVTTGSIGLLYLQLSTLMIAALAVAVLWVLARFSYLSGQPA
ncbi:hypothetical protein D769_12351 [Cupriavidus sp. HMR-1]|nr:hypothetical protein D769_12351 [Cupriavidus sp. HMR-1]